VLLSVILGCVILIVLCLVVLIQLDKHYGTAPLFLGLLFPCVLVICVAFSVAAYGAVHLICPQEEAEEDGGYDGGGQEMSTHDVVVENVSLISSSVAGNLGVHLVNDDDGCENSVAVNREI